MHASSIKVFYIVKHEQLIKKRKEMGIDDNDIQIIIELY